MSIVQIPWKKVTIGHWFIGLVAHAYGLFKPFNRHQTRSQLLQLSKSLQKSMTT